MSSRPLDDLIHCSIYQDQGKVTQRGVGQALLKGAR
uniref:Uncharacterized protein n=1 Tax=Anguilla anguilla TaxID=7936 RepID=A0A0E9UBN7_ANGAN